MLLGLATWGVPQGPFNDTKNSRPRLEFMKKIVDSFRQHWRRDVRPALVARKARDTEGRNLEVDDLVVMTDHNAIHGR